MVRDIDGLGVFLLSARVKFVVSIVVRWSIFNAPTCNLGMPFCCYWEGLVTGAGGLRGLSWEKQKTHKTRTSGHDNTNIEILANGLIGMKHGNHTRVFQHSIYLSTQRHVREVHQSCPCNLIPAF
jgi:hypothetical protein